MKDAAVNRLITLCDPATPALARYRWWLWPNLLCLDAPLVTVVWQRFLSFAYGVRPPLAAAICLAGVVWGVYLLDHWLDTRTGSPGEWAPRHQLARDNLEIFSIAAGLSFLLAALVAFFWLSTPYLVWGGVVGLAVLAYLSAVHYSPWGQPLRRGGKELAVGAVTAVGVSLPLLVDIPERIGDWWPAVGGFAALCWLNCRLIATWEAQAGTAGSWRRMTLAAILSAGSAAVSPPSIALALLGSLAILCLLHLARRRLNDSALRVLADAALLTPLLTGSMS